MGVNVNGVTASLEEVAVRPFGDYALYTVSFAAAARGHHSSMDVLAAVTRIRRDRRCGR